MRIMELYRIESEYKSHKKRLSKIKDSSSLEKIKRVTHQHFYVTNELKKIKQQDQSFQQKEEISRRQHTQSLMDKTLHGNFKKIKAQYEPYPTISYSNTKSFRNSPGHFQPDKTHNELVYLKHKIDNMQSKYKWRKNSETDGLRLERDRKKSDKEAIAELLKQQFKIESKVVFPRCKNKNIQNSRTHLVSDPQKSQRAQNKNHLESVGSIQKI